MSRRRPEVVVAEPHSGPKSFSQAVDDIGCGHAPLEGTGREPHTPGLIGQNRGSFRAQLEHLAVHRVDQPCRRLAAQPLQQPPLVQIGASRQPGRSQRPLPSHRPVQPEPVAEVDHQRHHLALFVTPHLQGEGRQSVRICRLHCL